MIRTLQDHGIHQGIEVYMEHTILSLLKDGDRVVGAFGYERERGRFKIFRAKAIVLATGGIGRAYKITSNSWESTGDGLARLRSRRGIDRHGVRAISSHRHGLAAERDGNSRDRRRARRRRNPNEQRGQAFHVRFDSGKLSRADGRQRRRRLAILSGRQECAASARSY